LRKQPAHDFPRYLAVTMQRPRLMDSQSDLANAGCGFDFMKSALALP
jgi:hypothetical protein